MNLLYHTDVAIKIGEAATGGATVTYTLDSDYLVDDGTGTVGTGDCVGARFMVPSSCHVHDVYWFVDVAHPISANLRCDLCSAGGSTSRAGASLDYATAAGGTTDDKWIKFTFTGDVALSPGTIYWLVIGDPAGATQGSDGYQILGRNYGVMGVLPAHILCHSSTDGFRTNGANISYPVPFVVTFSNGDVYGHATTASTSYTSNTLERGMKITFDEDTSIYGVVFNSLANASTFQVHNDGDQPLAGTESLFSGFNSGAVYSFTAHDLAYTRIIFAPVTFPKGTYRFTIAFKSSSTSPGYYYLEDAGTITETDLVKLNLFNGCSTIDSGAGAGWTDYDDAATGIWFTRMYLLVNTNSAVDTPTASNVRATDTVRGATGEIATQTLSAANDTVAAGYYEATTLSDVDADLAAANIVSGKTIFGVAGSATGGGGGGGLPILGGSIVR